MEKRPYCGKCHSSAVYRDLDPRTGSVDIACAKCGNRYPGGFGFYMAEKPKEDLDVIKKECRNCKRVKGIVRDGLCWKCASAVKDTPLDGPERESSLAAVAADIADGKVKPRGLYKMKKKNDHGREGKGSLADKTPITAGGYPFDGLAIVTSDPPPTKTKREEEGSPGRPHKPTSAGSSPALATKIPSVTVISIEFHGPDEALFHQFCALSSELRRTPENQLLMMIQEEVKVGGTTA